MPSAEHLLSGLDPDQRVAATSLHGPVAIIAGAGSGKTRVITHRIAYAIHTGEHDARSSVAVTFTAKAAGEMTRRLRALAVPEVRVRTFHAAALRQLRHYYPQVLNRELPEVTAVKAPLLGATATGLSLPANAAALRDYASEIEWAKVNSIPPRDYCQAIDRARRQPPAGLPGPVMAEIFEEYERRKTAAGRIDFEDVLLLMVALLEARPEVAAHVRGGLRHITVDEYQDASPVQQRLLDAWLGDNDNLCVVGDPSQTIYSFAGADASLLTTFADRYPDATVVRLPSTYRCTPEITATANRVLAAGGEGLTLTSRQQSGPAVRVRGYADAAAEAGGVADQIADLLADGVAASDVAILMRLNALTEPFEEALSARGIGYQVSGGTGFFRRAEVRKALTVIRGAGVATAAGTDTAQGAADSLSQTVAALLAGLGWTPQPPLTAGASRDRWESLAALHAAAREFEASHPGATLRDFAAELTDRAERADAPDGAGVTLASLHSAKGAEWPVVFLVGLAEGVLPHSSATTAGDIAEERRLLYVGITRAAKRLVLTYSKARSAGGRERSPSRFLAAISEDVAATMAANRQTAKASGKRGRGAKARRCRNCGKPLDTGAEQALGRCRDCPGTVDVDLLERLRSWRRQAAEDLAAAKGKDREPAFMVARDETLEAIAEKRPTDLAALASIPGIGPSKLDDYGEAILEVVNEGLPVTQPD